MKNLTLGPEASPWVPATLPTEQKPLVPLTDGELHLTLSLLDYLGFLAYGWVADRPLIADLENPIGSLEYVLLEFEEWVEARANGALLEYQLMEMEDIFWLFLRYVDQEFPDTSFDEFFDPAIVLPIDDPNTVESIRGCLVSLLSEKVLTKKPKKAQVGFIISQFVGNMVHLCNGNLGLFEKTIQRVRQKNEHNRQRYLFDRPQNVSREAMQKREFKVLLVQRVLRSFYEKLLGENYPGYLKTWMIQPFHELFEKSLDDDRKFKDGLRVMIRNLMGVDASLLLEPAAVSQVRKQIGLADHPAFKYLREVMAQQGIKW